MGSRGSFINVDAGIFDFKSFTDENGIEHSMQNYYSIGDFENAKVLIQKKGSVKAPEYSHSPNSIYAIIQAGALKHLTYFNATHNQVVSIDLLHHHGPNKLQPHVHLNLDHTSDGTKPTKEQLALINRLKRRFKLK